MRDAKRGRELDALREELAKVRKEIEEWKRGFRERGKRRASSTEGRRARTGKPLGRKPGHPGAWAKEPARIDDEVEYPDEVLEGLDERSPIREPLAESRLAVQRAGTLTRDRLAFSRRQRNEPHHARRGASAGAVGASRSIFRPS